MASKLTAYQLLCSAHGSWNKAVQIAVIHNHNKGLRELLKIKPTNRTIGTDYQGTPLTAQPDINATHVGFTPLEQAARTGNLEAVKILIDYGLYHEKVQIGNAINLAQQTNHTKIADYLTARMTMEEKLAAATHSSGHAEKLIADFVAGGRRKSHRRRKRKSRRRRKRKSRKTRKGRKRRKRKSRKNRH